MENIFIRCSLVPGGLKCFVSGGWNILRLERFYLFYLSVYFFEFDFIFYLFYFVGGGEVPHHMPSFGQGIPFEESHLNARYFTVTIVTWEELNNNHELSIEYFDLQKYILKYFFRLWLLLVSQTLYLHC